MPVAPLNMSLEESMVDRALAPPPYDAVPKLKALFAITHNFPAMFGSCSFCPIKRFELTEPLSWTARNKAPTGLWYSRQ